MRRILVVAVLGLMVLGACGDDGGDAGGEGEDSPVADEGADTTTADPSATDGDAGDTDDAATGGAGAGDEAGSGMGRATIDGVSYEFPDVRDCGLGDTGFPDDRDFVGYSADGEVVMSVSYFEDESLAGLNSMSVEIDQPHALYSSQYAPDGEFVIDVLPDGAEGSTTVGAVGIEVSSGDREATWSFTC
ncbi:MAG: hypothetical protein ACLFRV_07540 [Acidimicrobiales bacterium]